MQTEPTSIFELPFPSSGTAGARFQKGLGRACELSIDGEDENAEPIRVSLKFEGVEAFRCTYLSSLTVELIKTAYDQVVDLGDTDWLRACSSRAVAFWQRH